MGTDSIADTPNHRSSLSSRLLGFHYRAEDYVHNWGSTEAEREAEYACERHVRGPHVHYYRAVDVEAPPPIVFRWLCQLRVAPYSYDWVDNWCKQSPRELTPGAGDLKVGEGWFLKIFKLVEFEQDKEFTLRIGRGRWFFGSEVGLTYVLTPRGTGSCRVVIDLITYKKPGLLAELRRRQFPWGELLMMRKQLLTIKQLAEAQARAGAIAD